MGGGGSACLPGSSYGRGRRGSGGAPVCCPPTLPLPPPRNWWRWDLGETSAEPAMVDAVLLLLTTDAFSPFRCLFGVAQVVEANRPEKLDVMGRILFCEGLTKVNGFWYSSKE